MLLTFCTRCSLCLIFYAIFERFILNLKYLEEVGAAPVSTVKNSENGTIQLNIWFIRKTMAYKVTQASGCEIILSKTGKLNRYDFYLIA